MTCGAFQQRPLVHIHMKNVHISTEMFQNFLYLDVSHTVGNKRKYVLWFKDKLTQKCVFCSWVPWQQSFCCSFTTNHHTSELLTFPSTITARGPYIALVIGSITCFKLAKHANFIHYQIHNSYISELPAFNNQMYQPI